MNKVLNINLGGYALTIDDDAYQYLDQYLDRVRRRFHESEGRDEIVGDIEARLGELISADMRSRTIVMLPDVEAAVKIMGMPEDFESGTTDTAAGGMDTGAAGSKSSSAAGGKRSGPGIKPGKRLFRDEEDKVVSGVCSGLAAYLGIQDPVWIRLAFVVLTFISGGFWVISYIILSVVVPAAKTAADRLAMRGEPINVDSIAQEIEAGFNRFGSQVNEFGDRINGGAVRSSGRNAVANGLSILGQIFAMMLKFIGKFGLVVIFVLGIVLFLALAAAVAALDDHEFVARSYELNRAGMAQILAGLKRLGLAHIPAHGNFVTFKVSDAAGVNQRLLKLGVIIRPIGGYGLPDWLRVTIGTEAENLRFLEALEVALKG